MDIEAALAHSAKPLTLWRMHQSLPGVPVFSGSAAEDWPAWALDALTICREETGAIAAFVQHQEAKKKSSPRR